MAPWDCRFDEYMVVWKCLLNLVIVIVIDLTLLKFIIGAHAKTASEALHLETATIPLRHIISIRRMLYFQVIMKSLFRRGLMKSLQREFMKHNNIIHVKVTGLCF